ncbi:hypothetical protein BOTCAL_0024g00190 [Botryotinia calthae]|uniref:Uncharacterized protein n=1 Tax=Botryotinia calthae TaxID=38488 RepID=A0A4Y8DEI7_9HELO|nr:hypothetical protein BOTCAL_0024g00190 [Botryotinia calthae]
MYRDEERKKSKRLVSEKWEAIEGMEGEDEPMVYDGLRIWGQTVLYPTVCRLTDKTEVEILGEWGYLSKHRMLWLAGLLCSAVRVG